MISEVGEVVGGGLSNAVDGASAGDELPVATTLFNGLNEAGVKYGVVQDIATLPHAFAGRDDFDVLVDKDDHATFCSIVRRLHGLRSVSLSCYDNVCVGREDWFVPDFSHGRYVHLDVHVGLRVGWEFRKRYLAFSYKDVRQWEYVTVAGATVPVVGAEDELRTTIARYAFRTWAFPWTRWVSVPGDWGTLPLRLPLVTRRGSLSVEYTLSRGGDTLCRMSLEGDVLRVHRGDLSRLRRSIRRECGFMIPALTDFAVHLARKTCYLAVRALQRVGPGCLPGKRRPANGGIVIAVVGPDGVGKTTQVDRLAQVFQWKFGCMRAYLGTGAGDGWWVRKWLQAVVAHRKDGIRKAIQQPPGRQYGKHWKGDLVAAAVVFWGVLIAMERYRVVKRAHRSATRGAIVICDRWPQALRDGCLDGPIIPPRRFAIPGLAALARLEQNLYQRMHQMRPHVVLHLVSDHLTSQLRKPGEISKSGFDARLSLMAQLRSLDGDIHVIDASESKAAVTRTLFRQVWMAL